MKTGKAFYRPMNRVVHAHIRSIMPADPRPDEPVFLGGGARPNARFQELCELAGIEPRANVETGRAPVMEPRLSASPRHRTPFTGRMAAAPRRAQTPATAYSTP